MDTMYTEEIHAKNLLKMLSDPNINPCDGSCPAAKDFSFKESPKIKNKNSIKCKVCSTFVSSEDSIFDYFSPHSICPCGQLYISHSDSKENNRKVQLKRTWLKLEEMGLLD